jgi:4-amino-4-deoxy-L-arabinose transferase-like glycosyltransferase
LRELAATAAPPSVAREQPSAGASARLLELLARPWAIVAVAFAWRIANVLRHGLYNISDAYGHLFFGYEVGRIASAVASGQGFSSPFPAASGPTAWLGPVYPLMVAGVFKVFGIYSTRSAVAILVLNSVFGALTALAVYLVGREMFGRTVALWSAWIFALLPYFVNWSTWIWETSLSTLLLAVIFLMTLRLERSGSRRQWAVYGLLWGVIALTNAATLIFLPVCVAWLWHYSRSRRQLLASLLLGAAVCGLTVAPWAARNYAVFGKLVFPRSDFGEELYMGNHEGSEGLCMFWDHPVWNKYEMARFSQLGELRYVAEKQQIAVNWIRQHPARFAQLTLKRVAFFWFDIPEQGRMANRFGMGSRHALFFGFALLAFWGLWRAWRRQVKGVFLFSGLFLLYPLVYYITHCHPRYQHPITPEMLLLSVFLLYTASQEPSALRIRQENLRQGGPPV